MCFIYSEKRINDNNTYNEGGIGPCEMDWTRPYLKF